MHEAVQIRLSPLFNLGTFPPARVVQHQVKDRRPNHLSNFETHCRKLRGLQLSTFRVCTSIARLEELGGRVHGWAAPAHIQAIRHFPGRIRGYERRRRDPYGNVVGLVRDLQRRPDSESIVRGCAVKFGTPLGNTADN